MGVGFSPLVREWNSFPAVTPELMGRAASKVENVDIVLAELTEEVAPLFRLRGVRGTTLEKWSVLCEAPSITSQRPYSQSG